MQLELLVLVGAVCTTARGSLEKVLCLYEQDVCYNTSIQVRKEPRHDTSCNQSLFNLSTNSLHSTPTIQFLDNVDLSETSLQCKEGLKRFSNAIANTEEWAYKMFDASAKVPSGILNGNLNQYGDFDECLEVEQAQYCLLELELSEFWKANAGIAKFEELVHNNYEIRGTFKDPAHRLPNFSTIKWGVCIPKECTPRDITMVVEANYHLKVNVRPGLCQTSKVPESKLTNIFITTFFAVCLAVILASDMRSKRSLNSEKRFSLLLGCFSPRANMKRLLTLEGNCIKSAHGIRALSALALVMSHKAVAQLFGPHTNMKLLVNRLDSYATVIGRNAIPYTDSFLFLSGLLTAQSFIWALRKGELNFMEKFTQRLFRILPSLLFMIFFCTLVLPSLGSGPLWPVLVNHHAELCKSYWWRNLLLVHNYFGFEKMCLTHTHQVGIDMQLFLIAPLMVLVFWYSRKIGYSLAALLAILSTYLRYSVAYDRELSGVVYYGISISTMFNTADYSYILPTHRATIYIFGICLSFVLEDKIAATWFRNLFGRICFFTVTLTCGLVTIFAPYKMSVKSYHYEKADAAIIAAYSPILWGTAIFWTIHSAHHNYGGWLQSILCWNGFQYFSKISYSFYLVQFPVFFFNVGSTKYPTPFNYYSYLDFWETSVIIILSVLLTLFIELPFRNIHRTFFIHKHRKQIDK